MSKVKRWVREWTSRTQGCWGYVHVCHLLLFVSVLQGEKGELGVKVSNAGGAGPKPHLPELPLLGPCHSCWFPCSPLPRVVLDLATLVPRARKANLVTLAPLEPSHSTPMAQWSRSPVPQGHQGEMEPLAGMANL